MAPSDRISELFWLEYGEQIRSRIPRAGQGKMFFLADQAQKAPPVGTHIPNEYKAKGLYDLSNNLLATDSIYYSPSDSHGFDKAVENYLNWVDLGGDGRDRRDIDEVFHREVGRRGGAEDGLEKVRKRAFARWERETEMGMTFQPFDDWAACGNAPELNQAQQSFQIADLTVNHVQRESNLPKSSMVQQDKDTLNKALSKHNDHDGYNMRAAAGSLLTSEELIRNQQNGERVQHPSYERVPLYESPDYERFVQRAMGKSPRSNYHPSQSIRFTIDTQKDPSRYNFGQTRAVDSEGASTGWFSFSSGEDRPSTLETGSETSQVSIKVTYDDLEVVTIDTGRWVPDVSKYKLRKDAPRNLKTLARVRQLVVISGLGYEITVPRSTARILDANLRHTASAGGSISVFGIRILLGRNGSSTREEQTHTISRGEDGMTWKIIPNYGSNCGTVVGVIGEPFGS